MSEKTVEMKLSSGKVFKMRELANGTHYFADTPEAVVIVLEKAKYEGTRIKIVYGDVETGISWHEENDVAGYVGRTGGNFKVPILLPKSTSRGGTTIIDSAIIGIRFSNRRNGGGRNGCWLYRNEKYTENE